MHHDDHHKRDRHPYHSQEGLGKWYSWDTPIGLSLSFAIILISIGLFLFLLHLVKIV